LGEKIQVTLIDKSNHHLFQPLLYQVATAGLSPADIATPIRQLLRAQKNADVVLGEVTAVNTAAKRVTVRERGAEERELPYDTLVLATGSTHSYFGHEEWSKDAPGLKSIADATRIRRRVLLAFEAAESETDLKRQRELLTFAIVGAGPTGVELAGAIAELARYALVRDFRHIDPKTARVVLIEANPEILKAFPPRLAAAARTKLERLGVEVKTGVRVESVDRDGVVLSGQRLPSACVIWAAGVTAIGAAKWLGVEADPAGRVKVAPDLSVPGHPEIFVIGDTALVMQNGAQLPGVAPVAMQQGHYVARVLTDRVKQGTAPQPFRYNDKGNLATVGRSFAIADFKGVRISGRPGWLLWLGVHIYYLIGFRNKILVLLEWAWAYLTFQRGARLIVEKE
jgi:NADH dehydrogenase